MQPQRADDLVLKAPLMAVPANRHEAERHGIKQIQLESR
jgi:hypothetical protein